MYIVIAHYEQKTKMTRRFYGDVQMFAHFHRVLKVDVRGTRFASFLVVSVPISHEHTGHVVSLFERKERKTNQFVGWKTIKKEIPREVFHNIICLWTRNC